MAQPNSDLRSRLAKVERPQELPWYLNEFEEVPEPAKTILLNYSNIPPDNVLQHVKDVVTGSSFRGDMSIPQSPAYPEILDRLKSGQKLLDVGCALGQELRHLVYDGVPSENIYGSDLHDDFFKIGYDLFADHSALKSKFIIGDIFDDNSDLVKELSDKVDIINAASFFHLFTFEQQVLVAKRLIGLLRAVPGSLLVGRQAGSTEPPDPEGEDQPAHYRHNPSTWKRLWERVSAETGTGWEVEAWMDEWVRPDKDSKEAYKLRFIVRRVQ
ncbi:hypothetical protein N7478_008576 [Penicillium angulare]|uniref:uncharacterized protein n=1 Tax=Penicillium angulare TaxID=116970 RepID=UPI00254024BA|nr:uncharacterized protein N7478_008576 [Penicillium angulare]KAJ5273451.1 hypothetical protein N7478_008576 [Penicillium angulare]